MLDHRQGNAGIALAWTGISHHIVSVKQFPIPAIMPKLYVAPIHGNPVFRRCGSTRATSRQLAERGQSRKIVRQGLTRNGGTISGFLLLTSFMEDVPGKRIITGGSSSHRGGPGKRRLLCQPILA